MLPQTKESLAVVQGAEIVDSLTPKEADIIVEGKRGPDTFASANIDFILRSKGVKTVIIGGFLTNCCVESTMRTAYENGYDVITLTDCAAGVSAEEHDNAIKFDFPMFSKPMISTEFIAGDEPVPSIRCCHREGFRRCLYACGRIGRAIGAAVASARLERE